MTSRLDHDPIGNDLQQFQRCQFVSGIRFRAGFLTCSKACADNEIEGDMVGGSDLSKATDRM
jgi:hypothetical protein